MRPAARERSLLGPSLGPRAGTRRRPIVAVCALLLVVPVARAGAPRARGTGAASGPPAAPAPGAVRMTIARLQYDGGGDWYANPSSLPNLLAAIAERTSLKVERTEGRVTLGDDALWDYPYLHMTGHGNVHFSDADVLRLRTYLARGGFLHADDNYGLDPSFRREMARVFPGHPLVDVPLSHPIYHILYDFPKGVPKIHEHDGLPARGYGIFLGDRLAVYYTFSSDLGNGWEDVGTYSDPPALHEAALRMGVNLFIYAVTSRPSS
jgi:hypothetical protein